MPTKKQLANLRPIKKGEKRASTPIDQHKNRRVVVKTTGAQYERLKELTEEAGAKNVSSYVRDVLGI